MPERSVEPVVEAIYKIASNRTIRAAMAQEALITAEYYRLAAWSNWLADALWQVYGGERK